MAGLADSYKVEIEFPSSALLGNAFILDDATLGQLDGIGRLGGRAFYDVTSSVQEISVSRGRSRQLDSFNAGQAVVTFNNNTRLFDPTNTSGIYYGGIAPRQPIRISANNTYIFYGWIDDWNIEYDVPTYSRASVTCIDAFSILSTIFIEEFATTNGQRSDQRMSTILALPEVTGLSLTTDFEVGVATLGDDLIPDQTVLLDYFQQINQSEFGYLFVNASGTLKSIARGASSAFAAATSATLPVFTDQTPAASLQFKYSTVGVQFGTELLYNRVNAQNVDSTSLQVANDASSQTEYQIRTFSLTNLILETDADALVLADYILNEYSRPVFRYDSATISLQGLSTANQNTLLGIELASLVKVVKNFATGTPTSVEKYAIIEGIEHTITLTEHTVKYNLSNADTDSLRLDSTLFGILDSNVLG